jgi:hypothetical protein
LYSIQVETVRGAIDARQDEPAISQALDQMRGCKLIAEGQVREQATGALHFGECENARGDEAAQPLSLFRRDARACIENAFAQRLLFQAQPGNGIVSRPGHRAPSIRGSGAGAG